MQLTDRNIVILKIIIEEYLKNGEVIGSKLLLSKFDLGVSSATVRGDMAKLEKMNLVFQPYASAGRVPTSSGIRAYIDYMMTQTPSYFLNENNIELKDSIKNFSDFTYNISSSLAKNTKEMSFFCIPSQNILSYNGINKFLENNKKNFLEDSIKIISMLDDKFNFNIFLDSLTLKDGINLFIGEENNLVHLKKFSIIIKPISINNEKGYIGIIGNVQQNYSYNISAIKGII